MTIPFTLLDGTAVTVDGPLDPSLPLVVLLHGLSGSEAHMTAPESAYPGLVFNRSAAVPPLRDEGFNVSMPFSPVARLFLDPPATGLTSWRDALKASGFTVVTYSQTAPFGVLAPNITQLTGLVTEVLMVEPRLKPLRVAFVGHSRGGVLARAFLVAAKTNPMLTGFLSQVTSVITLHSPNGGSSLASAAVTVDGLLAAAQTMSSGLGLTALSALVGVLRGFILNPGITELVPGSPTLAAIGAAEPVAGVIYRTFGGNSTEAVRLWPASTPRTARSCCRIRSSPFFTGTARPCSWVVR